MRRKNKVHTEGLSNFTIVFIVCLKYTQQQHQRYNNTNNLYNKYLPWRLRVNYFRLLQNSKSSKKLEKVEMFLQYKFSNLLFCFLHFSINIFVIIRICIHYTVLEISKKNKEKKEPNTQMRKTPKLPWFWLWWYSWYGAPPIED